MDFQRKPVISRQAFWDIDFEKIDFEKNARFIVEKIIERGTYQDFKNVLDFYGTERMKELVLNANWLSDIGINFCCKLFDLRPEDFKCYEKKQLNRAHWNF